MKKFALILQFCFGLVSIAHTQTVTIGNQVWMSENLNVDKFRNGDPIREAKTEAEWLLAGENKQPAWCYYNNDPANGGKYHKLYNWYAVNDSRGLAPDGWKVPSDAEWTALTDYLGGEAAAGTKMKSTSGWEENGNGTNESGFSALRGGFRDPNGKFDFVNSHGGWWSSTEKDANEAFHRHMNSTSGKVYGGTFSKITGFSVRCVRE